MIGYTLSDCILKEYINDTRNRVIPSLLFQIVDNNNYNLIVDDQGKIITLYTEIVKDCPLLTQWLKLMGESPTRWESINIDNIDTIQSDLELILTVCSSSADRLLIVNTKNGWTKRYRVSDVEYKFNGINFVVIDKDEAKTIQGFKSRKEVLESIGIIDKVVPVQQVLIQASENSTIKNIKIENHEKE